MLPNWRFEKTRERFTILCVVEKVSGNSHVAQPFEFQVYNDDVQLAVTLLRPPSDPFPPILHSPARQQRVPSETMSAAPTHTSPPVVSKKPKKARAALLWRAADVDRRGPNVQRQVRDVRFS